jgi:hypothetical protein
VLLVNEPKIAVRLYTETATNAENSGRLQDGR